MLGTILHSDMIALVIQEQHRIKLITIDLVDRHQRFKRQQMEILQQWMQQSADLKGTDIVLWN